ncbi:DegT/DnrJ/EryC1/StrS family aminotransferase [Tropicimonas sediminicola]|uniref:dTDP-4-amino-4,6-dideoxygalactose transaminase n=1 Tax=Tropicimonas sediminicola TaxID=1031541 RepID=A0A239EI31_9RHOB|nr:DegT/DnrJ/EryC1/StrS family aminotransferase [Tropicimonas sediminicola]SNS43544.1 dTDP-4-amino-4,6-dideoxygalactose transaminase [Tropicimonas sediminicola]
MHLSPYPRSRTYGAPAIYGRIAADALSLGAHRGEEDLQRLEAAFARMQGTRHALCLPQGRVGIYLALSEMIASGQEVVLSPYTIYDVVNMVLAAGGVPVFADVDPTTGNLSPEAVRAALSPRTGAVLATHIHGLSCDIEAILDICAERGVPVIEDCAQSLGARIGGRAVGSFGAAAIFSFSRAKNVNTIFGGMLVTSNDALFEQARDRLSAFDFEPLGRLVRRTATTVLLDFMTAPLIFQGVTFPLVRLDARKETGMVDRAIAAESSIERRDEIPEHYRRRMSPMQARLALMQIPSIEPNRQRRVEHAKLYQDGLSDLEWLRLPPMNDDGRNTYLSYPVQLDGRDAFMRHMLASGRDVRAQYYHNLAATRAFAEFHGDCPNTQKIAARTVLLPIYPGYPKSEIEKTIDAIRAFATAHRHTEIAAPA